MVAMKSYRKTMFVESRHKFQVYVTLR